MLKQYIRGIDKYMNAVSNRLSYLDLLRGIAALWMIEVHVVDVCLWSQYKTGFFYNMLNISNGFVAVCFIFCAGAGFILAAEKKADDYRSGSPALWKYLRRLLHILLMGYWLHLPAFSLQKTLHSDFNAMLRFFECDVLHAIALSSLIALGSVLVIKNRTVLLWWFSILALIAFFTTPFVWQYDAVSNLPVWLATLISKQPISKFPLIPYAGYFFTGAVVTSLFVRAQNKEKIANWGILISFAVPFVLFALKYSPLDYPGIEDWWRVSPGHMLYRTSVVMLVMFLLYRYQAMFENTTVARVLTLSGQESLFFYVFHLMLVYGTIANFGLHYLTASRYGWLETAAVFIAITAVTYSLASMWHSYKFHEPKKAQQLIFWLIVLFVVIFALVPENFG